jgi:hypothetical protein
MEAMKDKVRARPTIGTPSAVFTRGGAVSLLKTFTSIRHPRLGGSPVRRCHAIKAKTWLPLRETASHASHNIGVNIGRDHFFLSFKSPSLIAAYAPAKKPMRLEPIVMIHGGSISDTTPMSMSRAWSRAPPNVPPSQKTIQTTRIHGKPIRRSESAALARSKQGLASSLFTNKRPCGWLGGYDGWWF